MSYVTYKTSEFYQRVTSPQKSIPLPVTPQCGDVLLVCGRSLASTMLARYGAEGDVADYSHVAFVIAGDPVPLVVEAVIPRVRVSLVSEVLAHADHATIMRPRFLTGQHATLVAAACRTIGQWYGLTKYPAYIADALFHSDNFSRAMYLLPDFQVCSQHVGQIFATIPYTLGEHYSGLTPNEIAAWGASHPDEWEMLHVPV